MYRKILLLIAIANVFSLFGEERSHSDIESELQRLKNLFDKGLISKDIYEKMQIDILDVDTEVGKETYDWTCSYNGEKLTGDFFSENIEYSPSANAQQVVKEILDQSGLSPNFIVRPGNVPNAAAVISNRHRYVLYNPGFIRELKSLSRDNWSVYSVMAHEVGHHLQGHTISSSGSRPSLELEADEFSGHILAKMGATLEQAQFAMSKIGSDFRTHTHPAKPQRLGAIRDGWTAANGSGPIPDPVIDDQDESDENNEIECRSCDGIGTNDCRVCDGMGSSRCSSCRGLGAAVCGSCRGTGILYCVYGPCPGCGFTGQLYCGDCGATGGAECSRCYGIGETDCSSCAGEGEAECRRCDGEGYTRM